MDPAIIFYQQLAGMSFTLLGLWFGITTIAHGGWHGDPTRQRATLHIALHFLLPGSAAFGSLLAGSTAGGVVWRVTFVVAGTVGLAESIAFISSAGRPKARVGRTLALFDLPLYTLMIVGAFLRREVQPLTPLQFEGMITGTLFLLGLVYAWYAFAERDDAAQLERTGSGEPEQ